MAVTLTQAAKGTKLFGKILIASFLVFLLFKVSTDIYRLLFPKTVKPVIEPPTVEFGKLPSLKIESFSLPGLENTTFSLDLVTTSLPPAPDKVLVYPVLKAPYGFLALDRAKDLAKRLNFSAEPTALSSTQYLWTAPNRKLSMDVENLNFNYEYDYKADPSVFVSGQFLSQEAGLQLSLDVMKKRDLLGGGGSFGGERGADLAEGVKNAEYLIFDGSKLKIAPSLSQTSGVRVNFFRTPLNEIPIVSPKGKEGLVQLLISGLSDDPANKKFTQILNLNYTYWVINRESTATYPIISAQIAWDKLQTEKKYLVYLGRQEEQVYAPTVTNFTARQVFLAYLDSSDYQPFLQPIWVFEGKATLSDGGQEDFVAYVPAITNDWISTGE